MTAKCNKLADNYLTYLAEHFIVEERDFGCVLTTPFLRFNNDPYQIYIQDLGDGRVRVTDFGDTIADFELLGFDYQVGKKKETLDKLLKISEVQLNETRIELIAPKEDIPDAIHRLLRALMDISHMEYMARITKVPDFAKKVHVYLQEKKVLHDYQEGGVEVRYKDISFRFDMRSRVAAPESPGVLIRTYHVENKADALVHAETRAIGFFYLRKEGVPFYGVSVIDNSKGDFSQKALRLIDSASMATVLWDDHERLPGIIKEGVRQLSR